MGSPNVSSANIVRHHCKSPLTTSRICPHRWWIMAECLVQAVPAFCLHVVESVATLSRHASEDVRLIGLRRFMHCETFLCSVALTTQSPQSFVFVDGALCPSASATCQRRLRGGGGGRTSRCCSAFRPQLSRTFTLDFQHWCYDILVFSEILVIHTTKKCESTLAQETLRLKFALVGPLIGPFWALVSPCSRRNFRRRLLKLRRAVPLIVSRDSQRPTPCGLGAVRCRPHGIIGALSS